MCLCPWLTDRNHGSERLWDLQTVVSLVGMGKSRAVTQVYLSVIVSVEMCFVDSSFYKRKEKGEGGQFCAVRIKKMKQMYLNGLPVCFSTF